MKHRAWGASRFELLVVLVVVLVLLAGLLYRFREVQMAVERTAVVSVLDTIRAGVWLEAAARIGVEGDGALVYLATENPFPALHGAVSSYAGVISGGGRDLQAGAWYFDVERKKILYQPRFSENFFTSEMTSGSVEFTIAAMYRESPPHGRVFEGMRLTGQCACEWLPKHYAVSPAGRKQ